MTNKKKLGIRIKFFRVSKTNLTQKEMAKKLKIKLNTYINYENGKNEPSLFLLKKMLIIFNIKFEELLDFTNFQKPPLHHLVRNKKVGE